MLIPIQLPPGLYRNGTKYQSKGRWWLASLVRWFEGTIRPIGGWEELGAWGNVTTLFDDKFNGSTANLDTHTPDFPTSSNAWTDVSDAFGIDGAGSCAELKDDGGVYQATNAAAGLGVWLNGREAWFETTLDASSNSNLGFTFMNSIANSGKYWFRVTPVVGGGSIDLTLLFNSRDSSGNDEATRSKSFNFSNATNVSDLPYGAYRFGITVVQNALAFECWREPAGGGTRLPMCIWDGNSVALANRQDSDHVKVGLISQQQAGGSAGNWQRFFVSDFITAFTLAGIPRALLGWRGDDGNQLLAVGTQSKLYAHSVGVLYDITPAGFVAGLADTTSTAGQVSADGYGDGDYSDGPYGTFDPAQQDIETAAVWQLDTFGSFLVGCCTPNDGKLYSWDKNPANISVVMPNAPVGNRGVVVTPEGFVLALGVSGSARDLKWASQRTLDVWTPNYPFNTAGNFSLEGVGTVVCGRRAKGETLVWTDDDLHAVRYIGGLLGYAFEKIGSKCGIIAPNAVVVLDTKAVWMGKKKFHLYDGYVKTVPSEVGDYVFSDFNYTQQVKVHAVTNAQFGEITWYYPSAGSTENDRYVTWNHQENFWFYGDLPRTCGIDAGALHSPVLGAPNGKLYEHEKGDSKLDFSALPLPVILESGPVEMGVGDLIMYVSQLIPDEKTLGNLQFYLYTSFYPGGTEEVHGPFTISEITDVRFSGRWVRVKAEQVVAIDWRLGTLRLDVEQAGGR